MAQSLTRLRRSAGTRPTEDPPGSAFAANSASEPSVLRSIDSLVDLPSFDSRSGPAGTIVVKGDRLCAYALRRTAAEIFPETKVLVCHTGAQALAALRRSPVQLGLFGLGLPDIDGLDLLIRVAEERLVDRLLVVSARNDEHSRQVLRQVQIAGFFDCQAEDADNLGVAIYRVGCGGHYFSADRLAYIGAKRPTLNQILSQTELQVLAVIGDGCSDQEAADCLGLSASTVHCHRQHIMHKLDIQTRTALMRTAIERGVIRFSADRVLRPGMEQILAGRHLSVPLVNRVEIPDSLGKSSLRASSF